MKLNNLDLNLLVVFNAIYTEGSLTKAGEIVGITQPAVSVLFQNFVNILMISFL